MLLRQNLLLAGASGALGREVAQFARQQGHQLRLLGRSPERLAQVAQPSDQTVIADALNPSQLRGCCEGIDCVISCLGASVAMRSTEKRSYLKLDLPANLNLLKEAQAAGVKRFLYVSLWIEESYRHNGYVQAHEQVEAALKQSGLDWTILRPTGLFSAMNEFLAMARQGVAIIPGKGQVISNPVHQADVAKVIVSLIGGGPEDVGIGGPDFLSRREILELAFAAVGKQPKIIQLPVATLQGMASLIGLFDGRSKDILQFFAQVASTDVKAPVLGSQHLKDYFEQHSKPQN